MLKLLFASDSHTNLHRRAPTSYPDTQIITHDWLFRSDHSPGLPSQTRCTIPRFYSKVLSLFIAIILLILIL